MQFKSQLISGGGGYLYANLETFSGSLTSQIVPLEFQLLWQPRTPVSLAHYTVVFSLGFFLCSVLKSVLRGKAYDIIIFREKV